MLPDGLSAHVLATPQSLLRATVVALLQASGQQPTLRRLLFREGVGLLTFTVLVLLARAALLRVDDDCTSRTERSDSDRSQDVLHCHGRTVVATAFSRRVALAAISRKSPFGGLQAV